MLMIETWSCHLQFFSEPATQLRMSHGVTANSHSKMKDVFSLVIGWPSNCSLYAMYIVLCVGSNGVKAWCL